MKIFLILIFVIFQSQVQAAEKVEFVANEIHSLLVFIDAVAGSVKQPKELKSLFDKSSLKNSESEKMIQKYQDLRPAFQRFIEFKNLPSDRNNGISVQSLVWIQSVFAKDLNDFQNRVMSLMQYNEMLNFRSVLEYFYPIHQKLLWNPYGKEIDKKTVVFQNRSKQWKLDELFERAKKFYNSDWPESQKFRISLFPIPPQSIDSSASSYGPVESVGIIIGEKDDESRFGVIFHEICHSLYAAQNADFQKFLSKWFQENKSPYGKISQGWINEVMATALGNGWAYYQMKGKLDKGLWYNDPVIDEFSKALYPEVKKYIDFEKSIDESFVATAIDIFQKKFPESIHELNPLLANMILVTDGSFGSSRPFFQELLKNYKIRGMNSSSPINHSDTLKVIKNDSGSTVFILAAWKNRKQFESLKLDYPQVFGRVASAKEDRNIFGIFNMDGRKFIISILKSGKGYEYLTDKMKLIKKIERLNEFVDLDRI